MFNFISVFILEYLGSFFFWIFKGCKGTIKDEFYPEEQKHSTRIIKRIIGTCFVFILYLVYSKSKK